jgi:hypothetical protein
LGNVGRRFALPDPRRQVFRRAIERINIVAGVVEPVAHFLPRQAPARREAGADRLVHHVQPLAGLGVKRVKLHHLARQVGKLAGQPLHLLARRTGRQVRIGQRAAQRLGQIVGRRGARSAQSTGNVAISVSVRAGVSGRSSFSSCER